MAMLEFYVGTMGSSKTAGLLLKRFDVLKHGIKFLYVKSSIDTRDGDNVSISRAGMMAYVEQFNPEANLVELYRKRFEEIKIFFIDEVEFITKEQAKQLRIIASNFNIPVSAFGLRTDFMGNTFEGSQELFNLCDRIEILPNLCPCGELAIRNARYDAKTGDILYEGPQVEVGDDSRYIGLCDNCWKKGNVNGALEQLEINRKLVEEDQALALRLYLTSLSPAQLEEEIRRGEANVGFVKELYRKKTHIVVPEEGNI